MSATNAWSWGHNEFLAPVPHSFEEMLNHSDLRAGNDPALYNRFLHMVQRRFGTHAIQKRSGEHQLGLLQRARYIERAIRGHYYPMLVGYNENVVDDLLRLVFPNVPPNPELLVEPSLFNDAICLNSPNFSTGKGLKKLLTVYAYMHSRNLNIAQTPFVVGRIEHSHNVDVNRWKGGRLDALKDSYFHQNRSVVGDVKVWFGVHDDTHRDTDKFRDVLEVTLHSDTDKPTQVMVVANGYTSQIRAEFFEGRGADKYANKALELAKAKFTNWRDEMAFLGRIDHKIRKPTLNLESC